MDTDVARGILRSVVAASRWLFGPAALLFLAFAGWHSRDVFAALVERTEPAPLAAAVALWMVGHLLAPWSSAIVLGALDTRIRYRDLLAIHVARLPARYLPGGIWHAVSRVMDLHGRGVGRRELTTMIVLENSLPLATAALLGGASLCLTGNRQWPAIAALLAAPLVLLAAWLALRHRSLRPQERLGLRSLLVATAASAVFWVLAATSFYCYWCAFPEARSGAGALQIAGTYLVAWAAGFASVFAPQGIGVFEAVAAIFLKGAQGFAGAAVLIAGFRVVLLAADLLAWLTLFVVRRMGARAAAN